MIWCNYRQTIYYLAVKIWTEDRIFCRKWNFQWLIRVCKILQNDSRLPNTDKFSKYDQHTTGKLCSDYIDNSSLKKKNELWPEENLFRVRSKTDIFTNAQFPENFYSCFIILIFRNNDATNIMLSPKYDFERKTWSHRSLSMTLAVNFQIKKLTLRRNGTLSTDPE